MVLVVDQQHVVVRVENHVCRTVEFAVTVPDITPHRSWVASGTVNCDALEDFVGKVEITVGVKRQGGGADHVAHVAPVTADLSKILVVEFHHLDANDIQSNGIAAADDKDYAVLSYHHIRRKMEASATLVGVEADRVEVSYLEFGCG